MKFGFWVLNQWDKADNMTQKINEGIEQVKFAREAGFDFIGTGQHFLSYPFQMVSTLPYLARLAQESGDMEVVAGVLLLPLLNPVETAEATASLDAMTNGKFIMGVGIGYRDEEFISFNVKTKERIPRLLESLDLIKQLWTKDEIKFDGEFYTVPYSKIATHPITKPHPPIWMAANLDVAVKRAARNGYPWLINPHATTTSLIPQIQMYKDVAMKANGFVPHLPMLKELYVHKDSSIAYSRAQPFLEPKYAAYASWGQDEVLPNNETFKIPFEQLAKDRFMLGSPEEIVEEIKSYEENLGITHMFFRMQWAGLPHSEVLEQIELFRTEIIPYFK